jgi:DNA polymerase-3 subunit delta
VEGNLMAAAQEVEKLALAWPAGRLSSEQVRGAVLDVSRHDPSALGLAIIAGDRERVVRMIDGLRAEGAPLPLVMWGVAQELRRIAGAQEVLARGGGQAAAMREAAAFREREAPVRRALERIDLRRARRGLRLAAEIDRAAKGLGRRDPWVLLTELALRMSAAPAARRSASQARRGGETG